MPKQQLGDYSGMCKWWVSHTCCLSLQRLECYIGKNSACKKVTFLITWEKDLLGFLVLKSDAGSAFSVTAIRLWFLHCTTRAPKLLRVWCWDKFCPGFLSSAVGWKTEGKCTPYWVEQLKCITRLCQNLRSHKWQSYPTEISMWETSWEPVCNLIMQEF